MKNEKMLHMAAFLIMAVGGLNWGLIGLFDFNLVDMLFGAWPTVVRIIYILVGVATVYTVVTYKKYCKL